MDKIKDIFQLLKLEFDEIKYNEIISNRFENDKT
jgi:hypothetical protein